MNGRHGKYTGPGGRFDWYLWTEDHGGPVAHTPAASGSGGTKQPDQEVVFREAGGVREELEKVREELRQERARRRRQLVNQAPLDPPPHPTAGSPVGPSFERLFDRFRR